MHAYSSFEEPFQMTYSCKILKNTLASFFENEAIKYFNLSHVQIIREKLLLMTKTVIHIAFVGFLPVLVDLGLYNSVIGFLTFIKVKLANGRYNLK